MKRQDPVTAYSEACKLIPEMQAIDDVALRTERWEELRKMLKSCFKSLLEAANPGSPEIWHALGDAVSSGRGTPHDKQAAIEWFTRAANAGHARSMVDLGLCLSPENREGAFSWFHRAAELGDHGAMAKLGFAYRDGNGVAPDPREAVRWFVKAADAGNKHAPLLAGLLYSWFLKSPVDAVPWLRRAAEAGRNESYIELAVLLDDRKSQIYDPAEAAKWYAFAIRRHTSAEPRALLALVQQHRDGVGLPLSADKRREYLGRLMAITPAKSEMHKKAIKLTKEIDEDLF